MPPPAAPRAFLRPRLHRLIARRFELRAIVVTAGAGFGKTTLLGQAVRENTLDRRGLDAWLTCEAADSSASTLLGALQRSIGRALDPDPRTDPPVHEDEPSVDELCALVWAQAPQPICLLLDDVHLIEPDSPGERALASLADQLPGNGHLVLAGRRRPRLNIARLLAAGAADELGEDELRLEPAEIERLAGAHGVSPTVLGDVGGWPALVELRASRGDRPGGLADRFVDEEVLRGATGIERRSLAVLSAIRGAGAEVAAEVVRAVTGAELDLGWLQRVPLVAVDRRGAIRPHALWSELLADELDADELDVARGVAAAVLTRAGQPADAFELLAAGEQWQAALAALFEACNDQRSPPWSDVIERWLRLLPGELAGEPEVAYARGLIRRGQDPWAPEAHDELADAIGEFRRRGDVVRELVSMIRASYVALVCEDLRWAHDAYRRLADFAASGLPVEPIGIVNRAMRELVGGQWSELAHTATQLEGLEPRLRFFRGYFAGLAELAAGDPDGALAAALDGAADAQLVIPAGGTAWAGLLPRLCRLAGGELAEHADVIDPGPRFANAERVPSLAVEALVRANCGDADGAGELLDVVDGLLPAGRRRPLADGFAGLAEAARLLAVGDEVAASSALRRRLGEEITPAGTGFVLLALPVHAYLFDIEARRWIADLPAGAGRRALLDGCDALLAARSGARPPAPSIASRPEALVANFGVRLGVELVVRTSSDYDAAAVLRVLAERFPSATRAAMRSLGEHADSRLARRVATLAGAVPIPPGEPITLGYLGPARLHRGTAVVDDANWRRARVRQLLACLVVHRTLRRQRLAELLWPEVPAESSSSNLRMTLSYAQALLEPGRERGDAPWFIRQDAGVLELRATGELDVDVWAFDRALDEASIVRDAGQPSVELEALLGALDRWRGAPFDDLGDAEWLTVERQRLVDRFLVASERAGALLVAAGRTDDSRAVAERALAVDGWHEGMHRVAIRARLAAGDVDGARAAARRCQAALDELGVRPLPETLVVIGAATRPTSG